MQALPFWRAVLQVRIDAADPNPQGRRLAQITKPDKSRNDALIIRAQNICHTDLPLTTTDPSSLGANCVVLLRCPQL